MENKKEIIRKIVTESIDSVIESITDKIYNELNLTTCADKQNTEEISHNDSALMLDTTLLPIMDKNKLRSYVDDSGFINVATISDKKIINLILEISATNGHFEIVKFLVESGVDINRTTALSGSALNGHLEIVKFLVTNGANINITFALVNSAYNGHFEIVKFLVESGVDNDAEKSLALVNSACNGHFEIVKFLVESGVDNDAEKSLASYGSAYNGHFEIVKFLVENGTNTTKILALTGSVKNGHIKIVKFLVKEYFKKGIKIPHSCITNEVNDINKFLFFYTSVCQDSLFNDEIVSSLASIKYHNLNHN